MKFRAILSFAVFILSASAAWSQAPFNCSTGAGNPPLRAEGITEVVGDILINCTGGTPGVTDTINLAVFLNVNVTNRITVSNATDVALTVDTGSGAVPVSVPGILQTAASVTFNGVTFTIPPTGAVNFHLFNLRGNVSQLGGSSQRPVTAQLSISGTPSALVAASNTLNVGLTAPGLLASYASSGIQNGGSPLPTTPITFASLFQAGTSFASTRVTEGFPGSFQVKTATSDTGTRIIARYSGFPAGSQVFVPSIVAGSDALQPTAAGDLGGVASPGGYAPTPSGTLALSIVTGTDANGAGGAVFFRPGPPGSGGIALNAMTQLFLSGGSGIAVYEVVDANQSVLESAQFPTFIGLPPTGGASAVASEQVSFAPLSTSFAATAADPIPRFIYTAPPSDCTALANCNASMFPVLSVGASQPLTFTAFAGSAPQTKTVQVNNRGAGELSWTASFAYLSGNAGNWLTISPTSGLNGGTVLVNVIPQNVGPGVYNASLIISGGAQAGSQTLPITLTVTQFTPPPPTVSIQSLVNAGNPASTAVSPGSLAILNGTNLQGKVVAVTFDGNPATIISSATGSITIQVPSSLSPGIKSQLQVTVDGNQSAAVGIPIAALSPAIFSDGVLNQDFSLNSASNPDALGSTLRLFGTGMIAPVPGPVTVQLGGAQLTPISAGPLGGWPGVNEVDVAIPANLAAGPTTVTVCGTGPAASQPICSQPAPVTLSLPQ